MLEFFKEGGWGMWPILILGLVTVGAAARFAFKPARDQIGFVGAMGLATLISIFHATWTDVGMVFGFIADHDPAPDTQLFRILAQGLKESTRPGAMGGSFLTFAAILLAVGVLRLGSSES